MTLGDQVRRAARHPTHVLPISVPVPATTTTRSGGRAGHRHRVTRRPSRPTPSSSSASTSRSTSPAVWAADSGDPEPARPLGHGRRANGGDQEPPIERAPADTASARASVAEQHRHDRARMARARPVDVGPQLRTERVALGRRDDADGGGGGRHVGRRRRGGEDERPGRVDAPVDDGRGPATNPPSDPRVFDSVPTTTRSHVGLGRGGRAEHGVGLVEDQQRVVASRRRPPGPSTSAASPSIEKTESLTPPVRGGPCGRGAGPRERGRGRRGGRPSTWPGRAGTPSMIEAWLSSSLRITVSSAPAAAAALPARRGWRRTRSETRGPTRFPSMPRARPPVRRAPVDRRRSAATPRSRCPSRSIAACAAARPSGCWDRPR